MPPQEGEPASRSSACSGALALALRGALPVHAYAPSGASLDAIRPQRLPCRACASSSPSATPATPVTCSRACGGCASGATKSSSWSGSRRREQEPRGAARRLRRPSSRALRTNSTPLTFARGSSPAGHAIAIWAARCGPGSTTCGSGSRSSRTPPSCGRARSPLSPRPCGADRGGRSVGGVPRVACRR